MPKVYYEPKDKKKYKQIKKNWQKTYKDYPKEIYVDKYNTSKKKGNGCIISLLLGIFLILFIPILIKIILLLGISTIISQQ